MAGLELLDEFIVRACRDPRIAISHIGLFAVLAAQWERQGRRNPLHVFARQVMTLCRISSSATYHKRIHELSDYGYLRFEVSFKKNAPSRIYLLPLSE